jgi:hypothetical protein
MLRGKKILGVVMSLLLLLAVAAPAFAGEDPQIDPKRDLQGLPHLSAHRWLFATAGGAAIGVGIGALLGGGAPNVGKGIMLGGGAASSMYLLSHHNTAAGWRDWAFIGSNTMLGGGLGWTLCGCNTGLVSGMLIGGGGTAFWDAFGGRNGVRTAINKTKNTVQQDISH